MEQLHLNGFRVTTNPIADGDVGLVIRQDGTVEAVLHSASEDGREISASYDRLKTVLALNILLAQEDLMSVAKSEVDKKIGDAMKLRVVN